MFSLEDHLLHFKYVKVSIIYCSKQIQAFVWCAGALEWILKVVSVTKGRVFPLVVLLQLKFQSTNILIKPIYEYLEMNYEQQQIKISEICFLLIQPGGHWKMFASGEQIFLM